TGSDQVWNPECQNEGRTLDEFYFWEGAKNKNKRIISYAASFGDYRFNAAEELHLVKYLRGYSAISIRERTSSAYIAKLIGREVTTVLDPTLVVNAEDWLEIARPVPSLANRKFSVVYQMNRNKINRAAVDFLRSKQRTGTIVVIDQSITAFHPNTLQLRDVGPAEFIWLMANASHIVSDSFHGCCFALNFNKPLIAVAPPRRAN